MTQGKQSERQRLIELRESICASARVDRINELISKLPPSDEETGNG